MAARCWPIIGCQLWTGSRTVAAERQRGEISRRLGLVQPHNATLQSVPQLLTARAYAAVVILSAFAILLFALLALAERLALPWAYQPRGDLTQ